MEIRKREAESTESELETDFISLKKTSRGANNMSSALSPSLSTPTLLAHLSTGVSLQIPRPVSPESTCQPLNMRCRCHDSGRSDCTGCRLSSSCRRTLNPLGDESWSLDTRKRLVGALGVDHSINEPLSQSATFSVDWFSPC